VLWVHSFEQACQQLHAVGPFQAHTHTHARARMHARDHAHSHTHSYTHTHTRTHARTHAITLTHTDSHTLTHTHTHTHKHTHQLLAVNGIFSSTLARYDINFELDLFNNALRLPTLLALAMSFDV
jgi:hypothetical protein